MDCAPRPSVLLPQTNASWPDAMGLVERVRSRNHPAIEELYRLIYRVAGAGYGRRLSGGEREDRLHEAFIIVVDAIEVGALRNPEALTAFIRTVLRYQAAASVRWAARRRREIPTEDDLPLQAGGRNPEELLLEIERKHLLRESLELLPPPDREILWRFYLQGQPRAQICDALHLSAEQFRIKKWRAKARFLSLAAKVL